MKDCFKFSMSLSLALILTAHINAQQSCCNQQYPGPPAVSNWHPAPVMSQAPVMIQGGYVGNQPLLYPIQTCPPVNCIQPQITSCPPALPPCHPIASCQVHPSSCQNSFAANPVFYPGTIVWQQPIQLTQATFPQCLPNPTQFPQPFVGPGAPGIAKKSCGFSTAGKPKMSVEEFRETFALNPKASYQQRLRSCYIYCDTFFPQGPCNGECHSYCPDFYVETCECELFNTPWGEVYLCSLTFLEPPTSSGDENSATSN